jgi:hypothetical protein
MKSRSHSAVTCTASLRISLICANRSKTWGKDGWKKIAVCIVSDHDVGRQKINFRMLKNFIINGKPVAACTCTRRICVTIDSLWRCIRPIIIHAHTTYIHTVERFTHVHCISSCKHIFLGSLYNPAPEFIWALRLKERVQVFTGNYGLYRYPCMVYPRISTQMNHRY